MDFDVRPNRRAGKVLVAPGIRFWRELKIAATDYHDMDLDVTVEWSDDLRRVVATKVEVRRRTDGPPITSELLREVALKAFVRNSILRSVQDGLTLDRGRDQEPRIFYGLIKITERDRLKSAGGSSPETIEWVARVYAVALAIGDAPTQSVGRVFEVSQSTAGAWVAAARRSGLLATSQGPGKALA